MKKITAKAKKVKYSRGYKSDERACYIMLLPQIIGFCVFTIVPLVWAMSLAWTYYDMISTRFVGFDNFRILCKDTQYWKALLNTIMYGIMKIPLELPIALILAVLLSKKIKFKGIYRGIYYLPHVISLALIALTFSNLFNHFGVINGLFTKFGLFDAPKDWFNNKWSAMFIIVLADIWGSFGVNVLYFVAALANVPEDVYESAKLDGATNLQCFFKMTLPLIAPTLQIILMLSIIGTLGINEMILVMTNGGPGGSTFSAQSYIFSNYAPGMASGTVNVGYGCAMSLVTGLILATITGTYMKFSSKLNDIY
ncbi:MAG: sugar ABC transporter permease [Sharpea porci]|uniref:carbohydrate ABC transporter permease n=1 Tax=Sharpea porci TaxID=2652286 RepID=UPI00240A4D63|nr:sugar ABC transporter permease [Sharpea porci]MDD6710530.1 sugar ABC transporter permease [Sharpea porci]